DTSSSFSNPTNLTTWANSTTYTDAGLQPGTTYYYRVKAHNATDSSEWSNTANATTQTTPTGYRAAVLADNPVSYWRLGETSGTAAADERGANPGTYGGGPTLGAASLLATDTANKAVAFDGVNDYVKVANAASLSFAGSFSLEAWIKPGSIPASGSFASILTKPESYSLQFNGPRLEFTIIQNGARKRLQAPSGAVVAGTTYHVVATYDGSMQRLYLNGKEVASTPLASGPTATSNPLYLGSWNGNIEFFEGTIDDAAVYNTVLSPAQVSAHYAAGGGSASAPVAAPSALTATAKSASQINLQWTDNSNNETGFVIERSTSSTFSSPFTATVGANATTYSDTGLAENTNYWYRVKAVNGAESSAYSNTASAMTQTAGTTGYRAAVLADNPVSYWRLGETSGTAAADERGANPGTYVNGPTLGAASLLTTDTANTAVTFDGTNDNVKVANSASLNLTNSFSLEAWIKPGSLPTTGNFTSILTKAESYSLQFNGPRLEFTIIQNGTRKRLQAPAGAVVAGTTYHVVATYDGTTQRLYLNGKEVANAALAGGASSTTNPLYLGSWNGSAEFFKGTIDDAAVYNTVLSPAQVSAHYAAGTSTGASVVNASTQTVTNPFLLASFGSSEYSIASEPTTFDYCQLEKPAILKGAQNTWRPLQS
ncbi:MAG: LamG-like jellyroll fold domain-containing protein, partial [Solirubrobacterales bacterium]